MELQFKIKHVYPPKSFLGDLSEDKHWKSPRVDVKVKFRIKKRWDNRTYTFILDTGACVSYAPDLILERLGISYNYEGFVFGILKKQDCWVKTKFAKIRIKLVDDHQKESKGLLARFAFHPFDGGPYLLGTNGILDNIGIIKKLDDDLISIITK